MIGLDAYKTALPPELEDEPAPCSRCEGAGYLVRARSWWSDERGQDSDDEQIDCPACGGDGRA